MDWMAMGLFQQLLDHQNIGKTLNNMHWFTIETDPAGPELFTSDQPLMMGPGFANPNAYVCLQIGPHRMFWVVRDPAGERQIRNREIAAIISGQRDRRHAGPMSAPLRPATATCFSCRSI
jgi:hypothetical protein